MALGSVGGIVIRVSADDTKFNSAMDRVSNSVAANARRLRASGNQFAKWSAISVAAAGAVATAMIKGQLGTLDALAKTSDALKIQQQNLQALQFQAELSGVSTEQLATNLERMQRRIGQVARSGGPAAKTLEEIGISAKDIVELSADKQLEEIAKSLGGMENASLRASIAMDLFGRDGVRMIKMLEGLKKDGLQGTVEELENLGIALTRLDTAKVEQANDAMFKSGQAVEGILNNVTVKVSPILQAMGDEFVKNAALTKGFGDTIDSVIKNTIKVVGILADSFRGLEMLFASMKVIGFSLGKAMVEVFRIMAKGVEQFVNLAIFNLNGMIKAINMLPGVAIPDISQFESKAAKMLEGFSKTASENLTGAIQDFKDVVSKPLPSVALDQFVKDAEDAAQKMAEIATTGALGGRPAKSGLSPEEQQAMQDKINLIRDNLKTEKDLRDEAYILDIEAIKNFGMLSEAAKAEADALELARTQQHVNAIVDIEKKAADAKKAIVDAENRAKIAAVSSAFGDLSSLMNSGSKKAFEIGKKAAVASAAISGTQAAIDAWKAGMSTGGPTAPFVAAAYAASSIAKTGMMIRQINQQQFGGAASGNSTSFSGGVPAVNTQSSGGQSGGNQNINISGIDRNSLISGGQLVDTLNQALGDGFTINFAGG